LSERGDHKLRTKAFLITAIVFGSVLNAGTPAFAASTCIRTGDTLNVSLEGSNQIFESFHLAREITGEIRLTRAALLSETPISCGDATVTNVNQIEVSGTDAIENLQVNLSFGGFRPGQTLEGAPEQSEIEMSINLGKGQDTAIVTGTSGIDRLVMGTNGINVNDDGDGNDIGFGPSVELPGMSGDDGRDVLRASGGSATGRAARHPVALIGGEGRDKLRGGSAGDFITGQEENDLLEGGPGNDRLGADVGPLGFPITEPGDDAIRGGPGGDLLRGGADDDELDGGTGDDEEFGMDGADIFRQGSRSNGADDLVGGSDEDEASYKKRNSRVRASLDNRANDGARREKDAVGFKGDVENVTGGRAGDEIRGNNDPNVLKGRGGPDLLVGRGGVDECLGGPGADTLRSCE
jgi:Ca2+-binding RTX toxin-like protein